MDSQDTRTRKALKALKGLGHSKGTWALGHSRHLGTWALRHSDTLSLEALEALYLADSKELHDVAKEYGKIRKIDRKGQIGRNEKTDRNGLEKKKKAMICYATEDEA